MVYVRNLFENGRTQIHALLAIIVSLASQQIHLLLKRQALLLKSEHFLGAIGDISILILTQELLQLDVLRQQNLVNLLLRELVGLSFPLKLRL